MSLRIKIISLFLASAIFSGGYIFLYWMPQSEQAYVKGLSETTVRELRTTAVMLVSPILQNQYALIHENLNALLEQSPQWVSIELIDDGGHRLFPLRAPASAKPGQFTFQHDVGSNGARFGTLNLIIDLTADIKALQERGYQLVIVLFVGFLVILLITVGVLEAFVNRPVSKLSHAARRLSDGDFDSKLPPRGKDEIGDLIDSFASMRQSIRDSQERLMKSGVELANSEARFRDFSASASDWYWEMDENLMFSYLSGRFKKTTGVDKNRLLGRTREEIGNPGLSEEDWKKHIEKMAARKPFRNNVYRQTKRDGGVVWLSVSGVPVFDEEGRFHGYRGTGADITELKETELLLHKNQVQLKALLEDAESSRDLLEEKVDQRTRELQQKSDDLGSVLSSERAMGEQQRQFISMVSHEFRTPLAIIDGAAQRIIRRKDRMTADDLDTRLGKIRNAVKRMAELMESNLTSGSLEAGASDITREPVDLVALVREVCDRQQEVSSSHVLTTDLDKLPTFISGDHRALEQVFTNLLSNAVKYAPDNPRIEISGWVEDAMVVVSVRDYGVGIPEKKSPICSFDISARVRRRASWGQASAWPWSNNWLNCTRA
jgi:PAS domain S-box-containing protein